MVKKICLIQRNHIAEVHNCIPYWEAVLSIILICLFMGSGLEMQAQEFHWAKGIGGSEDAEGNAIVSSPTGNIYVSGRFEGTVDFDPGTQSANLKSNGRQDIFLAKYDSTGAYRWAMNIGGSSFDQPYELAIGGDGSLYIVGRYRDTVDFDPSANTAIMISDNGTYDGFLAKYDTMGNYQWAISLGGTFNNDRVNSISLCDSGEIFIAGTFYGTVDFDPGSNMQNISPNGGQDAFIANYDTGGNFKWALPIGGSGFDEGLSIACDSKRKSVVIGGIFRDSVDFNPGPDTAALQSKGLDDGFAVSYDFFGNYRWAIGLGGDEDSDEVSSLTIDNNGNLIISGYFSGEMDVDPELDTTNLTSNMELGPFGTVYDRDYYLAKYDISGSLNWANVIGGSEHQMNLAKLNIDNYGNIFIGGSIDEGEVIDFDPSQVDDNLTSSGDDDLFLARYDSLGNYEWAFTTGGLADEFCYDFTLSESNAAIVTGKFEGSGDFDPQGTYELDAVNNDDVFIARYGAGCYPQNVILSESICEGESYNWSALSLDSSGQYTETYLSAKGCDSIVTLNLTVNPVHSIQKSLTICSGSSFAFGNDTLTSAGFYTHTFTSQYGCDSMVALNLSVTVPPPVNQTASICPGETYSFGGQTLNQGGTYTHTFTTPNGCDSTVILNLHISQVDSMDQNVAICEGESYEFGGQNHTTAGTYTEVFQQVNGCDSVVTLNLTVNETDTAVSVDQFTLMAHTPNATYQWVDCDNNYAPIAGATGQSFAATSNGNYAVVVTTTNNCTDTSACHNITGVGIANIPGVQDINLFPNPSTGIAYLELDLEEVQNLHIEVQDSRGRKVYNKKVRAIIGKHTYELPLQRLAAGGYHLIISSNKGQAIRKKLVVVE